MKPAKTKEISVTISGKFFASIKWTFPFLYLLWAFQLGNPWVQFALGALLGLYEFYYWAILIFLIGFVGFFAYLHYTQFEKFREEMLKLPITPLEIKERICTGLYIGFIIGLVWVQDWSLVVCLTLIHIIAIFAHLFIPLFHLLYSEISEDEVDIGEPQ